MADIKIDLSSLPNFVTVRIGDAMFKIPWGKDKTIEFYYRQSGTGHHMYQWFDSQEMLDVLTGLEMETWNVYGLGEGGLKLRISPERGRDD